MTVFRARRGLVCSTLLVWTLFSGQVRAEDPTTLPESVLRMIGDANLHLSFQIEDLIEARYKGLIDSITRDMSARIEELEAELSDSRSENRMLKDQLLEFGDSSEFARPSSGFLGLRHCEYGAEVTEVLENSPAEAVGLEVGDIVTMIDGKSVSSVSLGPTLSAYEVGSPIEVFVDRDGVDFIFELTLSARDESDSLIADEFGIVNDSTAIDAEDELCDEVNHNDDLSTEAYSRVAHVDDEAVDVIPSHATDIDSLFEDDGLSTDDQPEIPAVPSEESEDPDDYDAYSFEAFEEDFAPESSSYFESEDAAATESGSTENTGNRFDVTEWFEDVRQFGNSFRRPQLEERILEPSGYGPTAPKEEEPLVFPEFAVENKQCFKEVKEVIPEE